MNTKQVQELLIIEGNLAAITHDGTGMMFINGRFFTEEAINKMSPEAERNNQKYFDAIRDWKKLTK